MTDERVLVTGASGFLGTHCILDLLAHGFRVRGTLRDTARADRVRAVIAAQGQNADAIEFVAADLLKDEGWAEAVAGCDYVLHVASPFFIAAPKDPDELIAPARDGTLRVLKAAKAAGVKRVVLTSSSAAIVGGQPERDTFTEENWTNLDSPRVAPYPRSKTIAERAAWDYVAGDGAGLELAVINPTLILGPALEKDIGTSADIVRRLLAGAMPALPRIGFTVVDVRDVAAAHRLAMTSPGAAGERFYASGEWAWLKEMADFLKAEYPDRPVPTRELPNAVVRVMALFMPDLRSIRSDLGRRITTSNEKAKTKLGWTPRSWRDAVRATAESLIELGVV